VTAAITSHPPVGMMTRARFISFLLLPASSAAAAALSSLSLLRLLFWSASVRSPREGVEEESQEARMEIRGEDDMDRQWRREDWQSILKQRPMKQRSEEAKSAHIES
jgi:hypothetical protein